MLSGARVLVAEDQALIAFELASAVADANGEVVGPVASVREGLDLLAREDVTGAILDVRLVDEDVTPIATILLDRQRPMIFHAGLPVPDEIIRRWGQIAVCPKPMRSEHVVRHLASLIAGDETS